MNEQETVTTNTTSNALNLQHSLDFLRRVVETRMRVHFGGLAKDNEEAKSLDLVCVDDGSALAKFMRSTTFTFDEYVIFLLAFVPHVRPYFLDKLIRDTLPDSSDFPEIGGVRDKDSRVFFPTGETAAFLLAGDDLDARFKVQNALSSEHWFAHKQILHLEPVEEGKPILSGRLLLNPEYIELLTLGRISTPAFSATFPAQEITTKFEWHDLILSPDVRRSIEKIKRWVKHHDTLLDKWGMSKKIKRGYRALFHGPPGTGKTLTASLLGKYTGRQVFRIDLATVVSKYIGETEKNLANLFDKAKNKNWILFFDEADALFGKRTTVKDSHDRYANQEISYLLQRVEEFDGLVILASNFKANLDEAFLRRFNAIIKFPFPSEEERVAIWRTSIPSNVEFEDAVDLPALLGRFELAGGNIINVVQDTCIEAIARNSQTIRLEDALLGIRHEVEKEGKVFKNVLGDA